MSAAASRARSIASCPDSLLVERRLLEPLELRLLELPLRELRLLELPLLPELRVREPELPLLAPEPLLLPLEPLVVLRFRVPLRSAIG
jgi:hypothetical protein